MESIKWFRKSAIIFSILTIVLLGNTMAFAQNDKVLGNEEHHVVINQPPAGWDPQTASDEELAKYAYPPRPKDAKEQVTWKANVKGKWFRPVFQKTNIIRHTDQDQIQNSTSSSSYIWSGVVSHQTTQARITGFWRQPLATAISSNRPAYSSQWLGLGGRYESVLIQAGTESDIFANSSGSYNVWYEIVGTNLIQNQINITNFSHSPGDTYYEDISFIKGSPGSALFYIKDNSNNVVTSFTVSNINYNSDLTTSEWIFERPTIGGSIAPNLTKPDVGYVHFSQSTSASTPYGSPVTLSGTASTTDYRSMKSSDLLRTLASPGSVNSTGDFDNTWYNYN